MKLLFWIPTILYSLILSVLPKQIFKYMYKPSNQTQREISEEARNAMRLADYRAKRALWGVKD